jgi:hypothetical protein
MALLNATAEVHLLVLKMVQILTADKFLWYGLELVGGWYSQNGQERRTCRASKIEEFSAFFGSKPNVLAELWVDLQSTNLPLAQISGKDVNVNMFLMAMHFHKRYQTEKEWSLLFKTNVCYARDWAWFFVGKVAALQPAKIVWPDHWTKNPNGADVPVFLVLVDGVHC